MTASRPPVDLAFRPTSYWDPASAESAILLNVKGDLRRQMIRDFITGQAGHLGEIDPELLEPELDEETRSNLGANDPRWLGGEYLPDYLPGEVEIARLVLESTTRDVYSVRARRRTRGIKYRVVDEYDTVFKLTRRSSVQPVRLGELIELIESAAVDGADRTESFTDEFRDAAAEDTGSLEESADFIHVESDLYPELARWSAWKAADWIDRRIAVDDVTG